MRTKRTDSIFNRLASFIGGKQAPKQNTTPAQVNTNHPVFSEKAYDRGGELGFAHTAFKRASKATGASEEETASKWAGFHPNDPRTVGEFLDEIWPEGETKFKAQAFDAVANAADHAPKRQTSGVMASIQKTVAVPSPTQSSTLKQ